MTTWFLHSDARYSQGAMSVVDDEIDRRVVLRRLPSYGPDWDAAIEYGIDVAQTELNLALTPEQRILQLEALLRLHDELRPTGPVSDDSDTLSTR